MGVYSITFLGATVTAAQDLTEIVSAAAGEIEIHGFSAFQTSDHGDAAAEGLSISWVRGHTTSGSGGSSFTPIPRSSKLPAASATCEINNTTIASGGTAVSYACDGWNIQAGAAFWWTPETRPVLRNSERGVLRMTAPADAITMNFTIYFEER